MEAEKERLLSEQASAEEERIRKKMEKLQNREKNKKTKNKASASTPASEGTTTELPLQKGDFVSLPNKAIGEILEINDKTAVIALGNLRTTAKLSQLKRASASQAKKVARTQPQASYANIRENISQKRFDFKPDIVSGACAEKKPCKSDHLPRRSRYAQLQRSKATTRHRDRSFAATDPSISQHQPARRFLRR